MEFRRANERGLFRTRKSDSKCPRVCPCGYQCEAGRGDHEGLHLFEEHEHLPIFAMPSDQRRPEG